ncbi:zf-HC2 domain-containing protein [Paenibacillus sp. BR1-192]|uniref:zf-HC2 domain-containing protein n=1 Tax=Paenibacillus sp. BR1-192 TaxID=3032287 RepID=UPI00240DDA86|nr:zf-HC2 domain-containing protein [Paenibacillus sp. BR1-192]WFB59800.1 zf-HC2 domain-containing protein [Paenibacillus sp. BR1-192]
MKQEQSTIHCDICLDLIPLVRDGVASDGSVAAVMEHMADCQACRLEYGELAHVSEPVPNDGKILHSIRKHLMLSALAFLGTGAMLGISLTNSFGMFYNLLIMPLIGGLSYIVLRRKWYMAPLGIFTLSYVWQFVHSLFEGALAEGWRFAVIAAPLLFSIIYGCLAAIGILIASLLHYAFRKETMT